MYTLEDPQLKDSELASVSCYATMGQSRRPASSPSGRMLLDCNAWMEIEPYELGQGSAAAKLGWSDLARELQRHTHSCILQYSLPAGGMHKPKAYVALLREARAGSGKCV